MIWAAIIVFGIVFIASAVMKHKQKTDRKKELKAAQKWLDEQQGRFENYDD